MKDYLAVDLGASNGRTILGRFDGKRLAIEELSRFENNYIQTGDACYWNVLSLYANILQGIGAYARKGCGTLCGIGIDTWGVDFGLLDSQGRITGNPRAYRDPRGQRGMQAFHKKYGEKTLFDITGIANLEFNTAYQLYDMVQTGDPQLEIADKLLLMPDLLGYMLCGEASTEYTNATTTQLLDSKTGKWSEEIVDMIGVPRSLLTRIQASGETKGFLLKTLVEETGIDSAPALFCVGSHDTASAVASVPAANEDHAFISSGTWSLMGIVCSHAIISDMVFTNKLSNEGTVDGGFRPLRNIMGMWIIQNCKRQWNSESKLSWREIDDLVAQTPAFGSFIDVNARMFFTGENMQGNIQRYCAQTGQSVPQSKGEIARTVYESLAMSYKETFTALERIRGKRINTLHIIGGGSKNVLLNQMTASVLQREVIAGPVEATAIGNLMIQMKATSEAADMAQARQVIRDSFSVECFKPKDTDEWAEQFERYLKVKELRNI